MNDVSYGAARLLFYTEPTDRALIGWQPFNPYPADLNRWESVPTPWDYSVQAESRNIANALMEVCDS
jgi:hypothetical protein